MVKCLEFFFFKAIASAIKVESFFVLVKSYSISPVRLQRIMKKALFPSLFLRSLLITYLITLSLGKGSTVLFW